MEPNRREFLKMSMLSAGALAIGGCSFESCQQQIANRPMRKDINSLAANDPIIDAYKSAVTQMKSLQASDPLNWIAQANIHANHCPHSNWLFLPWHRWYLVYFERICQKLTGMSDFALPYWNWVKDPTVPAVFWGDASNPLYDSTRTIAPGQAIDSSLVGCGVVGGIMSDSNFISFASDSITLAQDQRTFAGYGNLEGTPHNGVHGAVGGNMGQITLSPRDPIFWLHHNMIEKCWVEWQFVRNNANTNDNNWTDRHFTEFYDQNGNPVDVQVALGLLLPVLSYQFDNLPVVPSPCPAGGSQAKAPGRARWAAEWEKFNSVTTRADQDALKARAQSGASVRLEVIQRFPLGPPASIVIGRPASLQIAAPVVSLKSALGAGERVFIRFNGVTLNHATDFFVKVFIDKPDATASTPDSDPHFVGSFAFFDHEHGGPGGASRGNYHLDASAAVKRLSLEGKSIGVNVVLASFPKREPKTNALEIASTEIQIVKDVIERREK
jgi:tyrosinase